jgi:hypothetical protein
LRWHHPWRSDRDLWSRRDTSRRLTGDPVVLRLALLHIGLRLRDLLIERLRRCRITAITELLLLLLKRRQPRAALLDIRLPSAQIGLVALLGRKPTARPEFLGARRRHKGQIVGACRAG